MTNGFSLNKYNLEVLERNADAIGKVKSRLEAVEKEIQNIVKQLERHDRNEESAHKELEKKVLELLDITKMLSNFIDAINPIDFAEEFKEYQKEFENRYMPSILKGQEILKEVRDLLKRNAEVETEKTRGKWGFRIAIASVIITQIGGIIVMLIDKYFSK